MIKTKWNVEAVKAYETGQGVELVNEPYPHYVPSTTESEKQEYGEPVGWIDSKGNMICTKINESCKPLYTTPQTKEWVGLTNEEIYEVYETTEKLVGEHWDNGGTILMFPTTLYQTIEAKLKEKNCE